jgi:hypothetical protein
VWKQDYNDYVLRNLGRGYTRHEMNVSFVRVRARAPAAPCATRAVALAVAAPLRLARCTRVGSAP